MNIKWVQYFTKRNEIKKEKKRIREQYKEIKYNIKQAVKKGQYSTYFILFLFNENIERLKKQGFEVEKIDERNWFISWEK